MSAKLALVIAAIGFIGALGGALIGGVIAITVERDQFAQQRLTTARDKRAQVYAQFLSTSNNLAIDQTTATDCVRALKRAGSTPRAARLTAAYVVCDVSSRNQLRAAVRADFGQVLNSRAAYQGAINAVYLYGSDQAVTASHAVSATLPPTLPAALTVVGSLASPAFVVSFRRFEAAWINFEGLTCREAAPQPARHCN